ncbi:MAG: Ku protein [Solirubrobacterales bacterium]
MARAIWSGTVSFGLLNVPVKLYSAVSRKAIRFNDLRGSDNARVRNRRIAEGTDEEVAYEEIVKGYEISPGRYVVITKHELSELDPKKSRSIEIKDFVEIGQIDPIFFETPYYLGPAEGAEKAYSLLARAMEASGRAAIARFVLRNREHLAAIRAADGVLTMTTMRFADEVVAPGELSDVLPTSKPRVAAKEVEMAERLIESLSTDFDPSAYRDEYREELLAMIERKAEGKEVVSPEAPEAEPTRAPDLMAALEESIAAVQGSEMGAPGRAAGPGAGAKPEAKRRGAGAKPEAKRRGAGAKPAAKGAGAGAKAAAKGPGTGGRPAAKGPSESKKAGASRRKASGRTAKGTSGGRAAKGARSRS